MAIPGIGSLTAGEGSKLGGDAGPATSSASQQKTTYRISGIQGNGNRWPFGDDDRQQWDQWMVAIALIGMTLALIRRK